MRNAFLWLQIGAVRSGVRRRITANAKVEKNSTMTERAVYWGMGVFDVHSTDQHLKSLDSYGY